MAISDSVATKRASAHASLTVEGRLTLPQRRALWRALYPDTTPEGLKTGHHRMVLLSVFAAQQALPFWYAVFPYDDTPQKMLRLAVECASGQIGNTQAVHERDAAYVLIVENQSYPEGKESALFAGQAAVATVTAALSHDLPSVDQTDDSDLDAENFETAFLAAAAFSGLPWSPHATARRRYAFWSWYLDAAIPLACDLAQRKDWPQTVLARPLLETGAVHLPGALMLMPELTEETFCASAAFAAATPFVQNGTYRSYRLLPVFIEDEQLLPVIFFEHGVLRRVSLHRAISPETNWKDIDTAEESRWIAALQQKMERCLHYPLPATFPWGQLSTSEDTRSGSAALVLEYAA